MAHLMNHVKSQCYVFFVTNKQLLIYVPPYMVMSEAQETYRTLLQLHILLPRENDFVTLPYAKKSLLNYVPVFFAISNS